MGQFAMTGQQRRLAILAVAVIAIGGMIVVGAAVAQPDAPTDRSTNQTVSQESSYLRVVHATADTQTVNVSVDGTATGNLSYGNTTAYYHLQPGNTSVEVANGTEQLIVNETLDVSPRTVTTLVVAPGTNETAGPQLTALDDDAYRPPANDSGVSMVHLDPDAPAVNLTLVPEQPAATATNGTTTETATDDATTETATDATTETATDATNETTPDATNETAPDATNETAPDATNETTPDATTETTPDATTETTPDATTETTPDATNETAGNNESTDRVVLSENLSYGEASNYTNVPAGNYTLEVRAAGDTGELIHTANVSLSGETVYTGLALPPANATGTDASLQLELVETASMSVSLPDVVTADTNETAASGTTPPSPTDGGEN